MEPKQHNTRHSVARATAKEETFLSPPMHRDNTKSDMYNTFQSWVLKTYGDSSKTKTVTHRKYNRILKILKGKEQKRAENSKFHFWVKAKGFRIGPPHGHEVTSNEQVLYIPCSKTSTTEGENMVYKKVAVVENFYDIIYGVHVEMNGRRGKHAGQKRTYKAIVEMYSFLPREAVTHFLMLCTYCQKRMHLGTEQRAASFSCHDNRLDENFDSLDTVPDNNSMHIDYNISITTTYLQHMRSLGFTEEDTLNTDQEDSEDGESKISEETNSSINLSTGAQMYVVKEEVSLDNPSSADPSNKQIKHAKFKRSLEWPQGSVSEEPVNMIKGSFTNNHHDHSYERVASPCNGCPKRESACTKDEDDDDDTDKIDINKYDPERLKAFNMFVRLFVDENLDLMVPISRQPKDRIQAIIDSCSRQFPEFSERARKRIRTYLKSCRRNKRTKEYTNWKLGRNTQPHLITALAEQILASACENENQNAKRMHLGLKAIPADVDQDQSKTLSSQQELQLREEKNSPFVNGEQNSAFFSSSYRLLPNNTSNEHASSNVSMSNGPTDLSMEKGICCQSSTSNHSLNPSEVISTKQLIAHYRESAAFLLRSADELEQILLQQT